MTPSTFLHVGIQLPTPTTIKTLQLTFFEKGESKPTNAPTESSIPPSCHINASRVVSLWISLAPTIVGEFEKRTIDSFQLFEILSIYIYQINIHHTISHTLKTHSNNSRQRRKRMGLEFALILLSDKRHLEDLTCALCHKLISLESWVTTPCHHPLCKKCVETWLTKSPAHASHNCPHCNQSILIGPSRNDCITIQGKAIAVKPFKTDQPLAFRMLNGLRVSCPKNETTGCSWTGMYGQLHKHKRAEHQGTFTQNKHLSKVMKRQGYSNSDKDDTKTNTPENDIQGKSRSNLVSNNGQHHETQQERKIRRNSSESAQSTSSDIFKRRDSSNGLNKISPDEIKRRECDNNSNGHGNHEQYRYTTRPLSSDIDDQQSGAHSRIDPTVSSLNQGSSSGTPRVRIRSMSPTGPTRPSHHGSSSLYGNNTRSQSISPMGRPGLTIGEKDKRGFGTIDSNTTPRTFTQTPVGAGKVNSSYQNTNTTQQEAQNTGMQPRHPHSQSIPKPKFLDPVTLLKDKANAAFRSGEYLESKQFSTDAILLYEQQKAYKGENAELAAMLYANRAAALLRLEEDTECIKDANCAIQADPGYPKAYLRKAWAQSELGQYHDALLTLSNGAKRNPSAKELKSELIVTKNTLAHLEMVEGLIKKSEFKSAHDALQVLKKSSRNTRVFLAFVDASLGLGNSESVIADTNIILANDPNNVNALEARGVAYFYNCDFNEAIRDISAASQFDNNDKKIQTKLEKYRGVQKLLLDAAIALKSKSYLGVIELCTRAFLESTPLPTPSQLNCVLHAQCGEARLGIKDFIAALSDATLSLLSKPNWLPALAIKVQVHQAQLNFRAIVDELNPIMKTWGRDDEYLKQVFKEAQLKLRISSSRVDFYDLFGVSTDAAVNEIQKQYRKLVRDCHPDRFAGSKYSEGDRKVAEVRFLLIGEGLEILSNELGRTLYDQGFQIDQIQRELNAVDRRQAAAECEV